MVQRHTRDLEGLVRRFHAEHFALSEGAPVDPMDDRPVLSCHDLLNLDGEDGEILVRLRQHLLEGFRAVEGFGKVRVGDDEIWCGEVVNDVKLTGISRLSELPRDLSGVGSRTHEPVAFVDLRITIESASHPPATCKTRASARRWRSS